MRPGDVITQYGGRTTEVTNTDAEGRLVLADGLAYAVDKLEPDALVDIATLTGGIKVALGQHTGGLFANDDALAGLLDAAGDRSGERVWRMPLSDGVRAQALLQDRRRRQRARRSAGDHRGAVPPALHRPPPVGPPRHRLDGDAPKDSFEWTEGPTGFGARLLLEWLGRPEPLAGVGA